ncbi:hypothetical protein [Bdellovibrio reynosensis]|uniref:Lipoprotein n=1 Tax=Bdellovibrio reynosensis TaxID=2835041 RepID=A0ABY4C714_9BACT|nr:hypothetical protein [Bdellovibrio reynosensis]UOF00772.1 hypothetical protein MNR06_13800 [Bdellovibrio reynosensis]
MKALIFFLLLTFAGLAFWGCPTKKYIPDPTPPQPQVRSSYDELLSLEGRAPPAGSRVMFKRMLAETQDKKVAVYLTVPL